MGHPTPPGDKSESLRIEAGEEQRGRWRPPHSHCQGCRRRVAMLCLSPLCHDAIVDSVAAPKALQRDGRAAMPPLTLPRRVRGLHLVSPLRRVYLQSAESSSEGMPHPTSIRGAGERPQEAARGAATDHGRLRMQGWPRRSANGGGGVVERSPLSQPHGGTSWAHGQRASRHEFPSPVSPPPRCGR